MKLDENIKQEISNRFNNYTKALLAVFIAIVIGVSIFIGQHSIIVGIVCFILIGNIGTILICCRMKDLKHRHMYRSVVSRHRNAKHT